MNEGGRNLAQLFLQSDILYIYSNICSSVSSNFKVASSLPPTNGQNKVQNVNQFTNVVAVNHTICSVVIY